VEIPIEISNIFLKVTQKQTLVVMAIIEIILINIQVLFQTTIAPHCFKFSNNNNNNNRFNQDS
jgi:hypothetical protein